MGIKVGIKYDDDIFATLRAFNRLQKETEDRNPNSELRQATKAISDELGKEIEKSAYVHRYSPAQAIKVASTIRVQSDRIPKISIGKGRKKIFSGGGRAGDVLFGNEFGAIPNGIGNSNFKGGKRFPPRSPKSGRGNEGYWIFPTIKANERYVREQWLKMANELAKTFSKDF